MIGLAEHYSKVAAGPAEADDDLRRPRWPPQLRRGFGGRQPVDHPESPEAVRQDGSGHQHRASVHDSDAIAAALLQRQRDRLGQHLHAPAVVRRRALASELQKIASDAFKLFGATMDLYPNPTPPASDMSSFFRFLPGIDTGEYHHYFHTDLETPQTVPWTGLEASTRAYAKIIDEVNKHPLSMFQRPEEPPPTAQAQAAPPAPSTRRPRQ
jgi:hypothetical protein